MNRDEFMELVYETFADEPDNVLANGIIEAADAYVEYEKARLSRKDTTSDLMDRIRQLLEDVADEHPYRIPRRYETYDKYNEGWTDAIDKIESMLPSVQPEPKEGEWVLKDHLWECNKCGCRINIKNPLCENEWNYFFCPHCGTKTIKAVQRF